jgi:hypothetical protein
MDSVKSLLGNDFASRASSMLGEDEHKVQTAVSGVVPSILTGILNKAGAGDAHGVLSMAKDTANSGILSSIGNFFGNNNLLAKGADLLKGIFGDRVGDVTNAIANFSGIRSSSAASLMSVAAPAALGALGKHADSTNMNTGSFLSFLNNQKDHILNALPSGLNLAGALGLSSLGSIGGKLSNAVANISGKVKGMPGKVVNKTGAGWLVPLLLPMKRFGLHYPTELNSKRTRVELKISWSVSYAILQNRSIRIPGSILTT